MSPSSGLLGAMSGIGMPMPPMAGPPQMMQPGMPGMMRPGMPGMGQESPQEESMEALPPDQLQALLAILGALAGSGQGNGISSDPSGGLGAISTARMAGGQPPY